MSPRNALYNLRDIRMIVAKCFRNLPNRLSGGIHVPHLYDLLRSKFGASRLTDGLPTLRDHIGVVIKPSSKEQMRRPYACRNVAFVENTKPVFDRAVGVNPRPAMGQHRNWFGGVKGTVALFSRNSRPQPTGFCFIYSAPKALGNGVNHA